MRRHQEPNCDYKLWNTISPSQCTRSSTHFFAINSSNDYNVVLSCLSVRLYFYAHLCSPKIKCFSVSSLLCKCIVRRCSGATKLMRKGEKSKRKTLWRRWIYCFVLRPISHGCSLYYIPADCCLCFALCASMATIAAIYLACDSSVHHRKMSITSMDITSNHPKLY